MTRGDETVVLKIPTKVLCEITEQKAPTAVAELRDNKDAWVGPAGRDSQKFILSTQAGEEALRVVREKGK